MKRILAGLFASLYGTASSEPYAEQYVAWHLMNAPGVRGNVTLTRIGQIGR